MYVFGQLKVGEVEGIPVIAIDGLRNLSFARPQPHVMIVASGHQSERRTPTAAAHNRDPLKRQ
jgi:hypothetical protein